MNLDSLDNRSPGTFQSTPSRSHLDRLEAEAIHILGEAVAGAANPRAALFSSSKPPATIEWE